jgi:hypothetical protein
MMKMRNLILVLVMMLLPVAGFAQSGTDVATGLVKIRYYSAFGELYLDEISPGIVGISNGEGKTFLLDSLGGGRYLLATDCEEADGYTRGRFVFNEFGPEFDTATTLVEAIRKGNALYVPDGVPVTDLSQLDALAQDGQIQKIDLTETNGFVITFTPAASLPFETSTPDGRVVIESEIGGFAGIDDYDGKIVFLIPRTPVISIFIIEPVEGGNNNAIGTVEASEVVYYNGILSVNTSAAEQIAVYSVSGQLLYRVQKPAGLAVFDLNSLPRGVLIVRGSSGWVRKVVK